MAHLFDRSLPRLHRDENRQRIVLGLSQTHIEDVRGECRAVPSKRGRWSDSHMRHTIARRSRSCPHCRGLIHNPHPPHRCRLRQRTRTSPKLAHSDDSSESASAETTSSMKSRCSQAPSSSSVFALSPRTTACFCGEGGVVKDHLCARGLGIYRNVEK